MEAMITASQVIQAFESTYGRVPVLVQSPGRINIIGEHTDYHDGLVMPAAIDKYIWLALSKNRLSFCTIDALNLDETGILQVIPTHNESEFPFWLNYFRGAIEVLRKKGFDVGGFDCTFGGDIPLGAGLSSSAALSCAILTGLNELFVFGIDKMDLALLARQIEHDYVGVKCGIMDQMACIFGREGKALLLDCDDYTLTEVDCNVQGGHWFLIDSGVKHALADSAYNTRLEEAAQAMQMINAQVARQLTFRDIGLVEVDEHLREFPVLHSRMKYYVEENARVKNMKEALEKADLLEVGNILREGHAGLRDLYEVSCEEVDYLIELINQNDVVLGARMMGGGFGGCILVFAKSPMRMDDFLQLQKDYQAATRHSCKHIEITLSNGCKILDYSLED